MWLPIPGYEGLYEASAEGQIRIVNPHRVSHDKFHRGRIMRQYVIPTGGYFALKLRDRGKHPRAHYVHVLIAAAFLGPRPGGDWRKVQVNHINGDRRDNRATNLEYITCRENHLHGAKLGLGYIGEKNGQAKLTADDVRKIRAMSLKEAQAAYPHMHYQSLYRVHRRILWRHID